MVASQCSLSQSRRSRLNEEFGTRMQSYCHNIAICGLPSRSSLIGLAIDKNRSLPQGENDIGNPLYRDDLHQSQLHSIQECKNQSPGVHKVRSHYIEVCGCLHQSIAFGRQ